MYEYVGRIQGRKKTFKKLSDEMSIEIDIEGIGSFILTETNFEVLNKLFNEMDEENWKKTESISICQ